ncbi:helix-turn-helix domain-containing protein [Oceanobacillus sp. FSL W7-1293]|uniref:AraC family transcriptional regulator n=1 Tax=Oceanobacillus sp. FSL W7-1293 TaxID=2921699 RepID=UPI0030D19258
MDLQELDRILRSLDEIEVKQRQRRENINDFDGNELYLEEGATIPRMQEKYFFDRGPIFINKHHRFAEMPVHTHDFIEINYVYSGKCKQFINGKEIVLEQGQLCILDKDVPHGIAHLNENDILINIIMKKETFSTSFFTRLSKTGIVPEFLLSIASNNQIRDRYILFHSEENKNLHYIIKNMIREYLDPDEYSTEMINSYILVMFTELMRVYQHDKNYDDIETLEGKTNIIDLLSFIETNYRNISLQYMAKEFYFNPNYLGNMLKEKTGKTFMELVQSQRLIRAGELLKNTNKSVVDIAHQVGYENINFFYRKFKHYYGITPNQMRRN